MTETHKNIFLQNLLGRNYKFTKQDWLVLSTLIAFYIIWTFRSWYGYEVLNLPKAECPSCSSFYWSLTKILWIPFSVLLGYFVFKKDWILKLGLQKPKLKDFKYLFLGLFVILFYIFVPVWIGLLDGNFSNWNLNFTLNAWFSWFVIIAFGEELLFRGFIFSWLQTKFNSYTTLILSSFLFSLVHYCWWVFAGIASFEGGVSIFVTGLILGYFRLKSGSVYVSTIMHFIFNLILTGFGY